MDVFKQQWERVQKQFAALTASQRMLGGALVAIMVMTVMLWGRYASSGESVPVVDRAFDPGDLIEAQHELKAEGIDAKISGDRIVVPDDEKDQAFAALSFHRLLPANTSSAFEDVLKQTNPFDDTDKSKLIFNHAREMQLAQTISTFPGVASAQVVINSTFERHIGDAPQMPGGTVVLQTRQDADIPQLVDSAAYTLVRTVSAMQASRVSVIVNGRTYKPHDPDNSAGGLGGDSLYEEIANQEKRFQDKIANVVQNYSNPLVSVSVDLNTETVEQTTTSYDPKKSVQQASMEDNQTDTSTSSNSGGEAGVAPNVGMSVSSGATPGNSTSTEHDKTAYVNAIGSTIERRSRPAGQPTVSAASVNLPRSDFLRRYKDENPGAKDPDEMTLENWSKHELQRVHAAVASACGLKADDDRIEVGIYLDSPSQIATANLGASSTASAGFSVAAHGKEIAIGVLAMASLFMVSMIVRKGAPAGAVLAGAGGSGGGGGGGILGGALGGLLDARSVASFSGDDDVAAVVGGGRPAMEGIELDEDSFKAQQMVEQVTTMVQEDPDAAASLVKRWLSK